MFGNFSQTILRKTKSTTRLMFGPAYKPFNSFQPQPPHLDPKARKNISSWQEWLKIFLRCIFQRKYLKFAQIVGDIDKRLTVLPISLDRLRNLSVAYLLVLRKFFFHFLDWTKYWPNNPHPQTSSLKLRLIIAMPLTFILKASQLGKHAAGVDKTITEADFLSDSSCSCCKHCIFWPNFRSSTVQLWAVETVHVKAFKDTTWIIPSISVDRVIKSWPSGCLPR